MDYHGLSKHISVARNVGLFSLASVAESSSCQSTVRARPVNKKKAGNSNPHLARSAAQLFLDLETVRYHLG